MATLQSFEEGIPISKLSNTFRDAITITRRLSIGYIRIDLLCIIQDSLLDWQQESAKIRSFYDLSFLNIAATGSVNREEGCFKKSNPFLGRPCEIHVTWFGSPGLLPGRYICLPCFIWNQHVENSPLVKRAWVLQKQFLAPRTLHFGTTQLFWEYC